MIFISEALFLHTINICSNRDRWFTLATFVKNKYLHIVSTNNVKIWQSLFRWHGKIFHYLQSVTIINTYQIGLMVKTNSCANDASVQPTTNDSGIHRAGFLHHSVGTKTDASTYTWCEYVNVASDEKLFQRSVHLTYHCCSSQKVITRSRDTPSLPICQVPMGSLLLPHFSFVHFSVNVEFGCTEDGQSVLVGLTPYDERHPIVCINHEPYLPRASKQSAATLECWEQLLEQLLEKKLHRINAKNDTCHPSVSLLHPQLREASNTMLVLWQCVSQDPRRDESNIWTWHFRLALFWCVRSPALFARRSCPIVRR